MTPIAALDWFLRNNDAVQSLAGERIYPDAAPKDERAPFVLYTRSDFGRIESLGNEGGSQVPGFLVSCFAETRADADTLAVAIAGTGKPGDNDYTPGIANWRSGYWGAGSDRLWIGASLVDEREANYIEPQDGAERGLYSVSLTTTIFSDGD